MTKGELIEALATREGLSTARAALVVNSVFEAPVGALQRGDWIDIRGFGRFSVRLYDPYSGRKPRTGSQVSVSAKRLPFFKAGTELNALLNNSRHPAITGGGPGTTE